MASSAGKALSEKLKKSRGNKAGKNGKNTDGRESHPGGGGNSSNTRGDPGGKKAAKAVSAREESAGGTWPYGKKAGPKSEAENLGANGSVTINGVPGYYCCDGGCDKATIGSVFAKALADAGTEIVQYDKPLTATLIDGSTGPAVTGYVVADVVLTTKCGEVVLPRTHIDVLEGPEKNRLLYIHQELVTTQVSN